MPNKIKQVIESDKFNFRTMYFTDRNQLSFMGPFDDSITGILGAYIKGSNLNEESFSDKVVQVFLELVRNVVRYSAERLIIPEHNVDNGIGSIIIRWDEVSYTFAVGNMVSKADAQILTKKCEIINSLKPEELEKSYLEQIELLPDTKKDTHKGLLQVALLTGEKLNSEITEIEGDQCFFRIAVTVKDK